MKECECNCIAFLQLYLVHGMSHQVRMTYAMDTSYCTSVTYRPAHSSAHIGKV